MAERHRRNGCGFGGFGTVVTRRRPVTDIPLLDADAGRTEIGEALDTAGCCLIENAADPSIMDAIRAEMTPYTGKATFGVGNFEGIRTRRTGSIVDRSETYRSLAMHPSVMTGGDHIFAKASSWMLSAVELIEIYPGQPDQMLHRYQWKYDYLDLPVEVECNGMWALDDFTEENGATRIIPGSHLWGNKERPTPDQSIPAEMAKGSLLIYTGRLYHGGGPNQSDAPRAGLSIQHCLGWLAQSEQIMLECPPAVVADWPDDLVRFIGYKKRADALGYFRDSEDPMAAVHPDRDLGRGWIIHDET